MIRILSFLLSFFCLSAFAQDTLRTPKEQKFFIRFGLGQAFGAGVGQDHEREEFIDGSYTEKYVPFTYGKGTNVNVGLGYMPTPSLGFDINTSVHLGGKNNATNVYHNTSGQYKYLLTQRNVDRANVFRIVPSVIITYPSKKVSPYVRLGLIYARAKAYYDSDESANFYEIKQFGKGIFASEIKGASGIGYTSSFGTLIKTNESKVDIFVELTHISLSMAFKSATKTKYEINGKNELNSLSEYEKETLYEEEFHYSQTTPDQTQAKKAARFKSTFTSIGLNVGFFVRL